MSILHLIRRTLAYFAKANLAVLFGVIAATATITGALVVGDSVRGTLREMTLERLGNIEHAVTSPRFFTQDTAASFVDGSIPAVLLTGTAKSGGRVAGAIEVVAVPPESADELWPSDPLKLEPGSIVLNARVAKELEAKPGDRISLLVEVPESVPRDTLLGERDEVIVELVVEVSQVLPESSGAGRFAMSPAQQLPAVTFLPLTDLQQGLDIETIAATKRTAGRPGRVNTAFIPQQSSVLDAPDPTTSLHRSLTLTDLDLRLIATDDPEVISVESRAQILSKGFESAIHRAAVSAGATESKSVLVYLVNEIANASDQEEFSTYSVAGGLEDLDGLPVEGNANLAANEVLINEWLAEDLGVQIGDDITVSYLAVGDTGELPELEATFRVSGFVQMEGRAIDRTLTPTVPGITDADSFADWDQPFTMDLNRVTDRDEDYWDLYRATPKLFLSLEAMRDRFSGRYGESTSVRVRGASTAALEKAILSELRATETGLVVRNIRSEQLAAAAGTTDFSGLFFGFSLFLIAAALLLIGLLFSLGIEQRSRQLGLLLSVGWTPKRLRTLLLGEGAALAAVGALVGIVAAIAYANVMIYGLTTWWGGATGTQFLELHTSAGSLGIGLIAASVVSVGVMWMSVRRLSKMQPRDLLGGTAAWSNKSPDQGVPGRSLAIISLFSAVLLLVALMSGAVPNSEAFAGFSWRVIGFFVSGVLGLTSGVALLRWRLGVSASPARFGLGHLGWQNTARARRRSLMTASLIASATFLLVAVAVAQKDPTAEEPVVHSGNGGFILVGETATPILTDLNTAEGRSDAQFLDIATAGEWPAGIQIDSLRVRAGDDASCLNLYSARLPKLLGVPEDVLKRWNEEGRFRFADTPSQSPWLDLLEPLESESELAIPVIGDMNTLLYSLHRGVRQTIAVPSEVHPAAELRVTGMLDGSVFQGTLLMSDRNLRKLDPSVVGFRYFLVESSLGSGPTAAELSLRLESGLTDYGFDAEPVASRIADFLAVQNTYLTTFQALGGLGLLLGTLGLGAVMLRNVVERAREIALMRAVGFRKQRLVALILGENALLLCSGLAIGTLSALLAMMPHLMSSSAAVPWLNLAGLLASVVAVGMVTAVFAVRRATSGEILPALKAE